MTEPVSPTRWWASCLQRVLTPLLRATITRSEDGQSLLLDAPDGRSFLITITEV